MAKPKLPENISISAFAALIGVSPRRIQQRIAEGVIKAAGRGEVELGASIRALLADAREAREAAPLTEARAKVAQARARQLDLQNMREDRRVIDVEEARALFQELAGLFVSGLSSLPARIGGKDIGLRRRIERECDGVRQQIVEKFEGALS